MAQVRQDPTDPNNTLVYDDRMSNADIQADIQQLVAASKGEQVANASANKAAAVQNKAASDLYAAAQRTRNAPIYDYDRTAGEITGDVTSSIAQTLVNYTAGTATGLGVAATADPVELRNAQRVAREQGQQFNPYVTGQQPSGSYSYRTQDPSAAPQEQEAPEQAEFLGNMNEVAIDASLAVTDFNKDIGDTFESQARKSSSDVYEQEKTKFQATEEYKNASDVEKIGMDISFTAKAMADNPLLAEAIGIEGLADLGLSILSGGVTAKFGRTAAEKAIVKQAKEAAEKARSAVVKEAADVADAAKLKATQTTAKAQDDFYTGQRDIPDNDQYGTASLQARNKASAEKAADARADVDAIQESVDTSADIAAKQAAQDVMDEAPARIAAAERAGAERGATIATAVQEGSSNTNQVVSEINDMTHEQLMASEEYRAALEENDGDQDRAKQQIIGMAGRNTFIGTGLSAAVIGRITGADSAAADVAQSAVKRVASRIGDIARETVEESLQSGVGQAQSNLAMRVADPTRSVADGVGEAIVQGAVGGALASAPVQVGATLAEGAVEAGQEAASRVGKIQENRAERKAAAEAAKASEEQAAAVVEEAQATVTQEQADMAEVSTQAEEVLQTPNENVNILKEATRQSNEYLANLTEKMKNPDTTLADILTEVAGARDSYNQIGTLSKQVLDTDPDISPEEKAFLERTQEVHGDSLMGKLQTYVAATPPLQVALDSAFEAATTGNTAGLDQVLGAIEQAGVTEGVRQQMVDTALSIKLYSGGVLSDPNITPDQLDSAAQQTTGIVAEQFEAAATLKRMPEVADDVINGTEDFIGVNTHLERLATAIEDGTDTTRTVTQLGNFLVNRQEKVAALQQGLKDLIGTDTKRLEVTYGNEGSWIIHNTDSGIAATEALLEQVQAEETLVADAVAAADILISGGAFTPSATTTEEAAVEGTPTEPVAEESPVSEEEAAAEEYTQQVVEDNRELRGRDLELSEETREDYVARAVSRIEADITDEQQILKIRQDALNRELGRTPTLSEESPLYQEVRASEQRISDLQGRAATERQRASTQYELENVDWDLAQDASRPESATKQLRNLVKNALGSITGKRAIAAINGEYADYGLDLTDTKSITTFLKDKSAPFVEQVLNFVANANLTKGDRSVVDKLIGSSKIITTAPQALKETLASLNTEYTAVDLGLASQNRFKKGVIAYRDSRLWGEDLNELSQLDPTLSEDALLAVLKAMGLEATRTDLPAIQHLAAKRTWFDAKFDEIEQKTIALLRKTKSSQADYDRQQLRFLMTAEGKFPQKIRDAAFMTYVNGTDTATESFYNDDQQVMSMLGLNDKSMLADIDGDTLRELHTLGAGITHKQMAREFKQALGIQHTRDLPQSVTDMVYSSMGGQLWNLMQNDPELIMREHKSAIGTFTGFTLNTTKSAESDKRSGNTPKRVPANSFLVAKNKKIGFFHQISEPTDTSPDNWVGQKPPKATNQDTHIRSRDQLTDDQVEAENIYREFKHEVDATVGSFVRMLGERGYKVFKGYEDDIDGYYNKEHRKTVEGKNQEIQDTYEKSIKLLDMVDAALDKTIYFTNAFSSVRRQQQRGAVNPQGNKFHRILIGHKAKARMPSINLSNLEGLKKGSANYNFLLALGQAYGLKVDKQRNAKSVKEMAAILSEVWNQSQEEINIYTKLGELMDAKGNFIAEIGTDLAEELREVTGGSDHHLQGILTVARLFRQANDSGVVKNFSHYLRAEVDGLTNGPAHSTVMNGLSGLSREARIAAFARGGYLAGDGTDRNTHVQLEDKDITDSYITVADKANAKMERAIQSLREEIASKGKEWKAAKRKLENYKFLAKLKMTIAPTLDDNGKMVGVTITRNGTKNPVTVTVYGGGPTGIHRKMAAELRDAFGERLTEMMEEVRTGKIDREALTKELNQWAQVFYGSATVLKGKEKGKPNLSLVNDINKAKTRGAIQEALANFTFEGIKEPSVQGIKSLYGTYITDAIDDVFAANKRSATLMNAAMNTVTALANDRFKKAYWALAEKRVLEGKIRGKVVDGKLTQMYDTLSSEDIGKLQRAIEDIYPMLRTAISDYTNISTQGTSSDSLGVERTGYTGLDGKEKRVEVDHTTRSMGLPGVRSIPVLTISIDGAVQINNHLLQGHHQNYLNVLDAIDRVADKNLRASNEIFNVAEYMGLMQADTLQSVQKAFLTAMKAQSKPLEIEGLSIEGAFQNIEMEPDSRLTLAEEELRQALKVITNPVANEFGLAPFDIGNQKELYSYLLNQLEVERKNNKLYRETFFFQPSAAVNQMAGIDDGHAQLSFGEVVLSDEAKAMLTEDGLKRIENFNRTIRKRRTQLVESGRKDALTVETDTELEEARQMIASGDPEQMAIGRQVVHRILAPMGGLWTDMRSTYDLDTDSFVFSLKNTMNKKAFKNVLNPTTSIFQVPQDKGTPASTMFLTEGTAIPSIGDNIREIMAGKVKDKDYLDKLLDEVEIHVTTNLEEGINGEYYAEARGKNKVARVIKVRTGLTAAEANVVVAHELVHAITQGGISKGLQDRKNKVKSKEADLVRDLWNQLGRFAKWHRDNPHTTISTDTSIVLFGYDAAMEGTATPAEVETTLNEFVATLAAENLSHVDFLRGSVEKSKVSRTLQGFMNKAWEAVKKYLKTLTGWKYYASKRHMETQNKVLKTHYVENDLLASIIAGLGDNALRKIIDPATGEPVLRSTSQVKEDLTPEENLVKMAEGQANNMLKAGFNAAVTAVATGLSNVTINDEIKFTEAENFAKATPAEREVRLQAYIDGYLNGGVEGGRMGGFRSTMAEFFKRSSDRSKRLDAFADRTKHAADTERESQKVVVQEQLEEQLGQNLTDDQNKAVMDGVIKADIFAISQDPAALRSLLGSKETRDRYIKAYTDRILGMEGASTAQKNLMINEALALGARQVTGGAYVGFNLPNAKAIVNMSGTNLRAVKRNRSSFERSVDVLASLKAMDTLTDAQRSDVSQLLNYRADGVKYAYDQHQATIAKIKEHYGEGQAMSMPKGFIPENANPNAGIRVVPASQAAKYPAFKRVRTFHTDPSDPKKEAMVLLHSKEGAHAPWVQGAMSTIESAIGGFTTTYGSATDKALPSYSAGTKEVQNINNKKARTTGAYVSRIREPRPMGDGMIPNLSSTGKVMGYRYVLPQVERDSLLQTNNDVIEALSNYSARVGEQMVAEDFNKQLVKQLKEEYDSLDYTPIEKREQFVKVHANSTDEEIAEIWRVIPQHTKKEIAAQWGGNFIYVHKRDFDNALGYREWNVSKEWNKNLEPGSRREYMVDLATLMLGDNALDKIRWADRAIREGVTLIKDVIVVKSVVVPVANIVSNAIHLNMRGVDWGDIVKDSKVAKEGLESYRADAKHLRSLRQTQAVTGEDLSVKIAEAEEKVKNNPVYFMVEQGLLPSVVEDIADFQKRGTVKEQLIDKVTPDWWSQSDNSLVDVGKNIVATQDSKTYKILADSVELGDFAAKYVLYNHLVNKEGVEPQDALDTVRVEFINYNTLSNKHLDTLNKVGGIFFFKYATRIQPILFDAIKRNPTRALMTWSGADTVGLPSIFDAMWLSKDWMATSGAYDLVNMGLDAHYISQLR